MKLQMSKSMEILALNLNKYQGIESVIKEDLIDNKVDYLLINGEQEKFSNFILGLDIGCLYTGFSPLGSSELVGLAALLSFLNGADHYTVKHYEGSVFNYSTDPLMLSLIGFFKSTDISKSIYHTYNISENTSGSYKYVPNFEAVVYPIFKFNKIIYSLYTTSLGVCQFKDMGKNILSSLNNHSISINLANQLSSFDTKLPEFKTLISCVDIYMKLAKRKDINALVFYVALFLNISSFNKNRNEFAVSYVFLQRAVETALTHYYLSSGTLEMNDYDRLCFKGDRKPIMGVGELIKEFFSKNQFPDLEKKICKLNIIRNCSVLAHGFYIPSSNEFNELFEASKLMIEKLFTAEDINNFYSISLKSLRPLARDHIKNKINSYFDNN